MKEYKITIDGENYFVKAKTIREALDFVSYSFDLASADKVVIEFVREV